MRQRTASLLSQHRAGGKLQSIAGRMERKYDKSAKPVIEPEWFHPPRQSRNRVAVAFALSPEAAQGIEDRPIESDGAALRGRICLKIES